MAIGGELIQEFFAKLGFEVDEGAFHKAEQLLGGINKGLAAIVGTAAAVVGTLFYVTEEVAKQGFEIDKTSQKLGINAQELQKLRFAAKETGVDSEQFTFGLQRMARAAQSASEGNQKAAFSFHQIGVGLTDASGKMKSPAVLAKDIADRFAKMPDGIRKTGLAMEVFGKSGANMIPVLNLGRKGLDEFGDELERVGGLMDDDMIARSKQAVQSAKLFGAALEGLKMTIAGPLLGAFNKYRDAISEWIIANRKIVAEKVVQLLHLIERAFLAIWRAVKLVSWTIQTSVKGWVMLFDQLDQMLGLFKGTAEAVGLALAGIFLIVAFPILGSILAIAGLIFLLEDLYVFLQGGDSLIGSVLIPMWDKFWNETWPKWLQTAKDAVAEFFKDLTRMAMQWIEDSPFGRLIGAIQDFTGTFSNIPAPAAGTPGLIGPAIPFRTDTSPQIGGLQIGEINVTGFDNPKAVADVVSRTIQDKHDEQMRRAASIFPMPASNQ